MGLGFSPKTVSRLRFFVTSYGLKCDAVSLGNMLGTYTVQIYMVSQPAIAYLNLIAITLAACTITY